MIIKSQNGMLILSNPETMGERVFMNTLHNILTETGQDTVEFKVNSMNIGDEASHIGLQPIIPEGFQSDGLGQGGIERKFCGCHICGDPRGH